MSENKKPEFIEKRFYWGTCYGLYDPKRKSAVIIAQRETPAETRRFAKEALGLVNDGMIYLDEGAKAQQKKMQEWGIPG